VLTLQALQQCGVNVTGSSHLHAAAIAAATRSSAGHSCAAVRALLACGADPHMLDSRGYTALHAAAAAQNCASKGIATRVSAANTVKVMQLLVAHCAEQDGFGQELLNATTPEGRTALHLSANHAAVTAALLQLGADIDVVDDGNITPLHLACFELSAVESVRELLRRGASTRAYTMPLRGHADEGCWLPVHLAAVYGSRRISSWLGTETVELRCDVLDALLASNDCLNEPTTAGCTAVWFVVRHCSDCSGVCEYLEALFAKEAELGTYSRQHGSLLHAAAAAGSTELLLLLLNKGLVVDDAAATGRTRGGATVLHRAARGGHLAAVQLLIDRGSDTAATDNAGRTALRLSLQGSCDAAACFTLLLEAGGDALEVTTSTR
jgi:ankyrin repeat protein